jgi:DNA helicase HerA-like ATPase
MVEKTLIRPPSSRLGPLTAAERKGLIQNSPVAGAYDTIEDRESAYEVLQKRAAKTAATQEEAEGEPGAEQPTGGGIGTILGSIFGTNKKRGERFTPTQRIAREVTRTATNRIAGQIAANVGKSVAGSVGGSIGRAVVRGVLGSILRS